MFGISEILLRVDSIIRANSVDYNCNRIVACVVWRVARVEQVFLIDSRNDTAMFITATLQKEHEWHYMISFVVAKQFRSLTRGRNNTPVTRMLSSLGEVTASLREFCFSLRSLSLWTPVVGWRSKKAVFPSRNEWIVRLRVQCD